MLDIPAIGDEIKPGQRIIGIKRLKQNADGSLVMVPLLLPSVIPL